MSPTMLYALRRIQCYWGPTRRAPGICYYCGHSVSKKPGFAYRVLASNKRRGRNPNFIHWMV